MASRRNKKRMNVNADRLSNLPDDIIHKILSFNDMEAVVRTSSLSSRWRFLWTSMPYLYFSSYAFPSEQKFYQSVHNVLRNRDNQMQVSSLDLRIYGLPRDAFVNAVLHYAFCHDVEEMTFQSNEKFHLFNFSSKSLKVLTLVAIKFDHSATCTSNWELPVLTTLNLIDVTLFDDEDFDKKEDYEAIIKSWDEFFSKCPDLKYLTLDDCGFDGGDFRICHPKLSKLKLANGDWAWNTVSVDTPQLKNLSIINCGHVYLSSAPELTSFIYRHLEAFEFKAKCLPSLEKVDLCICVPRPGNMKDIVKVLQKFESVKFLTINVEILELLSSQLNLVSNQPSPFANLKSLKIHPAMLDESEEYDYSMDDDDVEYKFRYELQLEEDEKKEEEEGEEEDEEEDEDDICAEVKNFFLDSSPSATVTKVTCQEITAVTTPKLVINLMEKLQVLLKKEEAKIIMACKKRGKTPMQSHVTELHEQGKTEVMKKMQLPAEERVLTIESRWKDPSVQNYLENGKIGHMVSKLQAIRGVLATLPTLKRGKMKACFGRLFAEANLVMKKIDDASSHNIGEEHVEEQLPQNQNEFDTECGKWYKRRCKGHSGISTQGLKSNYFKFLIIVRLCFFILCFWLASQTLVVMDLR